MSNLQIEENNDNKSQGNTSNSYNVNQNRKRMKRNRLTKNQQYENERKELVKELEGLMGLTEGTRYTLLYDLEHNQELKEYV
jgi:hypothetical protein